MPVLVQRVVGLWDKAAENLISLYMIGMGLQFLYEEGLVLLSCAIPVAATYLILI
jgi:hypothetical protein